MPTNALFIWATAPRQPAIGAVLKKLGYRSKSCPLDSAAVVRPGHHARECSSAWVPAAGDAPGTAAFSTFNSHGSAVVWDAADAVSGVIPSPWPGSAKVAVSTADPPGSVDVSVVHAAKMTDGKYVPSSDADSDPSSMDDVAESGDDEVVVAASSPSPSVASCRRRKRTRCTASPAVPSTLLDLDASAVEVPGHKQFKTFRGVREGKVSWEQLRSGKLRYRLIIAPPQPSFTPDLFSSQSFSAFSATPVPPASLAPFSFSFNGSVVDFV